MSGFETRRRSVAKSLSWRFFAAIITAFVAYFMTGQIDFAVKIGVTDTLVKLLVYFLHERVWNQINYGKVRAPDYQV
ncbi:MAG TPA: DUF2061 domain-containing protein [Polyangiaceae bacterium]|jgi:uncharacterized membrane protein|nr:DUF2061 domain-containing protein [Polyangiaceae bacterium]